MTAPLRERGRAILRAELAAAAAGICLERGYDEVTAEELAQGIGISRATFFRYFGSKEEVISTAMRGDPRSIAEIVQDLPAEPGTSGMDLVRAALGSIVEQVNAAPQRQRDLHRLVSGSPALRAHTAFGRTEQRRRLAEVLVERIEDPDEALAVSSASMAALELAWIRWEGREDADFGEILDRSFALISGAGEVRLRA